MGMEGRTGLPRTDKEIELAIGECKEILAKAPKTMPLLTAYLGTVIDGLGELLARRRGQWHSEEPK